jgi:hypothetical protein
MLQYLGIPSYLVRAACIPVPIARPRRTLGQSVPSGFSGVPSKPRFEALIHVYIE